MNHTGLRTSQEKWNPYGKVFLLCLLTGCLIFVPYIVMGGGIFTIRADFIYQQIPFNMMANEAVKSGDVFWNWNTDLGSAFVGYSFYNLGSPFFWLSLLFPGAVFPYLIGPLLILKCGVAGLTSYAFLQRYVKNKNYAVIAALLYAFSGYQSMNLLYNHFHDVVALFPLLLFTLDEMMENRRVGWFALAVALNALVNFVLFTGEVVFVVLYFVCRYLIPDFRSSIRKLPRCLLEAVIGLGMAAFLFLPSTLMVMTNPRTTGAFEGIPLRFGWQEYLRMIKAVLLPGDSQGFPTAYMANYDSQSFFLPMFSVSMVLAWMLKKRNFATGFVALLAVMAVIPFLNSVFYLGRDWRFRWVYMLILMMALITAMALDNLEEVGFRWGCGLAFGGTLLFSLFTWLYPKVRRIGDYIHDPKAFAVQVVLALGGIAVAWMLLEFFRNRRFFTAALTAGVILFASVSTSFNIHRMRQVGDSSAWVKDSYLAPMLKAELPDDPGARFMLPSVNQGLIADVPALPSFNSSVSGGVFELYSNMGVYRGHGNVPLLDHEDLRHLLSIKYIVNPTDDESLELLSQYTVGGNTYSVYENPQALPIGFTYAYYVTQERFLQIPVEKRAWVMCKALVVHEEDVDKLVGMQPLTDSQIDAVSEQDAVAELENRRRESSSSFSRDNRTFTADIHCREETMAFFSVTYDEGWSATVNGEAVPIVKSSGLMAVPVSGGDNHIVFHYTPPGGTAGIVLTAVSVLGLGVYWTLSRYLAKRKQREKEC